MKRAGGRRERDTCAVHGLYPFSFFFSLSLPISTCNSLFFFFFLLVFVFVCASYSCHRLFINFFLRQLSFSISFMLPPNVPSNICVLLLFFPFLSSRDFLNFPLSLSQLPPSIPFPFLFSYVAFHHVSSLFLPIHVSPSPFLHYPTYGHFFPPTVSLLSYPFLSITSTHLPFPLALYLFTHSYRALESFHHHFPRPLVTPLVSVPNLFFSIRPLLLCSPFPAPPFF